MLVLHYTGMQTGEAALARMCDPGAEVSAHYMVWESGEIVQLVEEEHRAWHAGVSSWQGESDLNSRSIGIEIVNGGHDWPAPDDRLPAYCEAQIDALIALCKSILARWTIPPTRIVGHSDIAPARKKDPGEHFPWDRLAAEGIGLMPVTDMPGQASAPGLIGRGLGPTDQGDAVLRVQTDLARIGYACAPSGVYDGQTESVIRAFQRRWVQDRVSGLGDLLTLQRLEQLAELYKTV